MDDLKTLVWSRAQRAFLADAADPDCRIAALSAPRGWGKTSLLAELIRRVMTPSEPMYEEHSDNLLIGASLKNVRPAFLMARAALGENDYSYQDSLVDIGIKHRKSRTRLSLRALNPKTISGVVGSRFVFCDEMGSWELTAGQAVWELLTSAQGKAGSPLTIIMASTLAPLACRSNHWFHDLMHAAPVDGVRRHLVQGREGKFTFKEAKRVNPLIDKKILKAEFAEAKRDTRKQAAFSSYRLNRPQRDIVSQLFTPTEWRNVLAREPGAKDGMAVVGIDIGSSRSWSAACAVYRSGRAECFALTGGKPAVQARERRDRVASGTYKRLVRDGSLVLEPHRTTPSVDYFLRQVKARWPQVELLIADFFKLTELRDFADRIFPGVRLESRRARWSDSTFDIAAARELALDGNLSVDACSGVLLTEGMAAGQVSTDSSGNSRLLKFDRMASRDDAVAAFLLAAGAHKRRLERPAPRPAFTFYFPSSAAAS